MNRSPEGRRVSLEIQGNPHEISKGKVAAPAGKGIVFRSPTIAAQVPRDEVTIAIQPTHVDEERRMTLEELKVGRSRRKIAVADIPGYLFNEILTKAAEEISQDERINLPPALLTGKDLQRKFIFWDNKSLEWISHNRDRRGKTDGKDNLAIIFEKAGIRITVEDLKKAAELKRDITWNRVSTDTLHEVFVLAAAEIGEKGIPVGALTPRDLIDNTFTFLGRSLASLVSYAKRENTDENKSPMAWLRERSGVEQTEKDIIASIILDRRIDWSQFDKSAFAAFLNVMAGKINKPIFLWEPNDFKIELDILEGRDLFKLYNHIMAHKGEQGISEYLYDFAEMEVTDLDLRWAKRLGEESSIENLPEEQKPKPKEKRRITVRAPRRIKEENAKPTPRRKPAIVPKENVVQKEPIKGKENIESAKTLSFLKMGAALHEDVANGTFSTEWTSLQDLKRAPLAKEVAEEKLREIGLEEYIVLDLGDAEEVKRGFNKKYSALIYDEETKKDKLDEIEKRRAVVGYKWKNQSVFENEIEKEELLNQLKAKIKESRNAEQELVSSNKNLVNSIAWNFSRKTGLEQQELAGDGFIGLLKAARRYDWRKAYAFSSYATHLIIGEIKHGLRTASSLKIPRKIFENYSRVRDAADRLNAKTTGYEEITTDRISRESGLTPSEVDEVLIYLDEASKPEPFHIWEADEENKRDVSDGTDRLDVKVQVQGAIKSLTEQERKVIFGIFYEAKTQATIAEEIGCSQMNVSTILSRAKKKMREALEDIE